MALLEPCGVNLKYDSFDLGRNGPDWPYCSKTLCARLNIDYNLCDYDCN